MADKQRQKRDAEEEDEEDLLAALEAEEDDPKYRANRIKQLQSELVLPCVLGFIDGTVVERITGFEGLVDMNALMGKKGSEKTTGEYFKTSMLEYRLVQTGLLKNAVLYGDNADDYDDDDRDDDEDNERTGKRKTIRTGKTMRRRGGEDDEDDWD
ncbi:hypothetical protein TEQG_08112 [Trichophyton equinum CBS 127.97]|uniref:Uncharacterized protein n=1 Tax=Trichophyton equinum (strain ATCC MYA-4606 / CBS 127.97) TaxID=559882 RepID=F2Q4U0_TRIEC|nr:hypothetical protein TEQG_08112 [Trichophyton equinum CBS 127.97]